MGNAPLTTVRARLMALCAAAALHSAAHALPWLDEGRPTGAAHGAVDVLAAAGDHGLDPADYGTASLRAWLDRAARGPALQPGTAAELEDALTRALQRYVADLREGRVQPRSIHADFDLPRRAPAEDAALQEAFAAGNLQQVLRHAEPQLPMYAGLRQALARYRALAGHAAWDAALPPLPGGKVAPGRAYPGLPVLADRLAALGDLPPGTPVPPRLEGTLLAGLQAFQERHGLRPDGVLGPATLEQLNATPARRARQIELALERLRWTPLLQGRRAIVVNVPEFVLRAYEVADGGIHVQLAMKVIVGRALRTRTPLLMREMRLIEFSPYWNVPPSIARAEIVPRLRRDPQYFEREGLEFVTGAGQAVTTLAPAHLAAVQAGRWRIRQRPGPQNALGGIKFVFPNDANVYLHDTPARELFERDRRDFSHGCIRVESPLALALFALHGRAEWNEARIREAMERGTSATVRLLEPVPVLVAYSTVVVRGAAVYFYGDVYGHDRLLDAALRARSAALPPLLPPPPGWPPASGPPSDTPRSAFAAVMQARDRHR